MFGIRVGAGSPQVGEQNISSLCRVAAVNNRSGAERLLGLRLEEPVLPPGRAAQFLVEVGVNEPWVGVVLHQAVDFPLSRQEDAHVWLVEVLHDSVLGVEVQVYLQPDRSSERQHQAAVQ